MKDYLKEIIEIDDYFGGNDIHIYLKFFEKYAKRVKSGAIELHNQLNGDLREIYFLNDKQEIESKYLEDFDRFYNKHLELSFNLIPEKQRKQISEDINQELEITYSLYLENKKLQKKILETIPNFQLVKHVK